MKWVIEVWQQFSAVGLDVTCVTELEMLLMALQYTTASGLDVTCITVLEMLLMALHTLWRYAEPYLVFY